MHSFMQATPNSYVKSSSEGFDRVQVSRVCTKLAKYKQFFYNNKINLLRNKTPQNVCQFLFLNSYSLKTNYVVILVELSYLYYNKFYFISLYFIIFNGYTKI